MRVILTKGPGGCNHITVQNVANGNVVAITTLAEIRSARPDPESNYLYDVPLRLRLLLRDGIDRAALPASPTMAQMKTYIEGLEI